MSGYKVDSGRVKDRIITGIPASPVNMLIFFNAAALLQDFGQVD